MQSPQQGYSVTAGSQRREFNVILLRPLPYIQPVSYKCNHRKGVPFQMRPAANPNHKSKGLTNSLDPLTLVAKFISPKAPIGGV